MPLTVGDAASLPQRTAKTVVNIAHSRKFNELDQSRRRSSRAFLLWAGSFVASYTLISQKALAGGVIHHDTAFLADHAVGGHFRHGDFVFSSTLTFMRPRQPFHEFGHDGPYRLDPSSPLNQRCVSRLAKGSGCPQSTHRNTR
jgi:hypothetical protein